VYQVIATVVAWLNLAEGQHLELEAGEDLDLVEREAAGEAADAARTWRKPSDWWRIGEGRRH
jgi:hypothetical protein